jgi:hypothetical protein
VTTGDITSSDDSFPDDYFFPNIDNLFGNMGSIIGANAAAAAAHAALFVTLSYPLQILLEFLF